MAAPKTTTTTKPKPKKKRPAPILPVASPGEKYDPSADRRTLQTLATRRGPVDPALRDAFATLLDDDARNALGVKTKAIGVFKDAVDWAVIIDKTFQSSPALLSRDYAPERFAYYLDRLGALDTVIVAQETSRQGKGDGKGTVAQREASLRKVREDVIFRLERFAGQRKDDNAALDAARGRSDNLDLLGKSILDLVTLGRGWLDRGDVATKIIAGTVGLTPALLDGAIATADSFTAAAADVALAGRDRAFDPPEVNVVEGAVLFEMAEVLACFAKANKESPLIPRLTPGDATRHVLGPRKPKAAAADPAKPADPAQPAADPAKPADPATPNA
jgi:hypothetical protein